MSQNYNHLDSIEGSSSPLARGLRVIFVGLLLGLSGVTSMAFFATYAAPMFQFLTGDQLAPWVAGLTGVLCFEIASVVWSYLRANDADTSSQIAIAGTAHWLSLIGGVLVTVIYLAMSSDLIQPYIDDQAQMVMAIIGTGLIVVGISGNFLAGSLYHSSSSSHTGASHQADLRALQTGVKNEIARQTAMSTLDRTMSEVQKGLPAEAQRQAEINSMAWLASQFTQAIQNSPGASQNGLPLVWPMSGENSGIGGGESPTEDKPDPKGHGA